MNIQKMIRGTDNAWAKGCAKCEFGLVDPPPTTEKSRRQQAEDGDLVFCDCKAGQAYKRLSEREKVKVPVVEEPFVRWDGPLPAHYGEDT